MFPYFLVKAPSVNPHSKASSVHVHPWWRFAVMVVTLVLQIASPLVSYWLCSGKSLFTIHGGAKLLAHQHRELTEMHSRNSADRDLWSSGQRSRGQNEPHGGWPVNQDWWTEPLVGGAPAEKQHKYRNVSTWGWPGKNTLPLEDRKELLLSVAVMLTTDLALSEIAVSHWTWVMTMAVFYLLALAGPKMSL
jgi:hypothetical protein